MGVGDEEFSPPAELQFKIDSKGVYGEMERNYRVWKEEPTDVSLGNLGVDQRVEIEGGPFDVAYFYMGTGYIYDGNRNKNPEPRFESTLYLRDSAKNYPNNGFISDDDVPRMQKALEDQGFESIEYINGTYDRFFRLTLGNQTFNIDLGERSLEDAIKTWENGKYGEPPTRNNHISLSQTSPTSGVKPDQALPFSEDEYGVLTEAQLGATKRAIWASEKFFGTLRSNSEADFLSTQTSKEQQQRTLGFSTSSYDEGEFEPDGKKGEAIYSGVDALVWNSEENKIYQWRGWGNRQVLTMEKDRLVFGRWAGVAASNDGTQADVLIDMDMDPDTHKVVKELSVSRKHFAISLDQQLVETLRETTEGLIDDAVVFEDLNPTNTTYIFRSSEASVALFGVAEEAQKGKKGYLLPGDMILVGGGVKNPQNVEDWVNQKNRGVGMIYLGDRKFVKLNISQDEDALHDIVAAVNPKLLDNLPPAGVLAGKAEDVMSGKMGDDPAVMEALRDIQASPTKEAASHVYSQEDIKQMEVLDLMDLLGNVEVPTENRIENALFAVTQREESEVVGYALVTALRQGGLEQVLPLLENSKVWQKIPKLMVLQALDYIETSDLEDQQKGKLLNIAYTSRDDDVKLLLRKRNERYIAKGLTSFH